ncbi:MAG: acetyl-CoA C-acetyltransferase [Candidatus Marinimicrobia bacterium]|jgi:acetyl-CoA C-acetyltransferase|nr:acetyl-CoA C-acetyltransferase [Candidatus Neomarinimicrobiota bacterium]MDP6569581.1 acetyl-CoA C-acetyltransferase [Candidatus Neomarinimicrobiota bacterium]MDP7025717.1 acetyl-CoA C-acetyltransferase [Candidatus Neomarinimicrobiota bacterium]|tara:strand:- start:5756 stop:6961 length:1206 start_codon:yes stop_codon:yes gene_type:complete
MVVTKVASDRQQVVIAGGKRTAVGAFQGSLASVPAARLGATAIMAALEVSGVSGDSVDEVIMGNVLSAGQGQAPARQAALYAGLHESVECLTINKMCGSGLKAVMLASQAIQCGDAEVIVAGGMESMSLSPFLIPRAKTGLRLGHTELVDSIITDGLWDVYNDKHMGSCAETCVRKYQFTREEQDEFARESYTRAQNAQVDGTIAKEIVPVEIKDRKGNLSEVAEDDEPQRANFEKMTKIRPAFEKDGTVTAANASKINDGAAAVVMMSAEKASELGINPVARIVAQASFAQEPEWFTTAPVGAIRKVLDKSGLTVDDIDIFEINEAFAAVTMAAEKELGLDHDKVNIHGGAVALGHPIGASGARILVTLLNAMESRKAKLGLASLCLGGGEASAVIVERL